MMLGDTGEKSLQALVKQDLLEGAKTFKLDFCEHCVIGKKTKVKFGNAIHCTKGIFDYVHVDIWGLFKMGSFGGNHYFVPFIDDYSRRCWVYTMRHKGKVHPEVVCGEEKIWRRIQKGRSNYSIQR